MSTPPDSELEDDESVSRQPHHRPPTGWRWWTVLRFRSARLPGWPHSQAPSLRWWSVHRASIERMPTAGIGVSPTVGVARVRLVTTQDAPCPSGWARWAGTSGGWVG